MIVRSYRGEGGGGGGGGRVSKGAEYTLPTDFLLLSSWNICSLGSIFFLHWFSSGLEVTQPQEEKTNNMFYIFNIFYFYFCCACVLLVWT